MTTDAFTQNGLKRVLIVGAGIAGCATAISLALRGIEVRLVEKQAEWKFQSSGIFVYSNGLACLRDLGVLPEILRAGFAVPDGRNVYYDHRGNHIVDVRYPALDGGAIPAILGIKRADLHRVLAGRIEDLKIRCELGLTVEDLTQSEGRVDVTLSNGERDIFDLVVGADGIRSQIRDMAGFAIEPRYTGFGVWRSVHKRPAELTDKIMMMGVGKRFGIMPISDDRLYTFGTIAEPKDRYYDPRSWADTMREKFAEFEGPARQFLDELGPESEVLFTAVEEIAMPLPWHRGRVLMIGDASHASTPFMGQGGAMAMQDAVLLGSMLDRRSPVDEMLRRFGEQRMPTCRFVQDVSRRVGELGAQEDAELLAERDTRLRQQAQADVDSFYGKLSELNAQAA